MGRGRARGPDRSPVLRPALAWRGSNTVQGQAPRTTPRPTPRGRALNKPGLPTSLFLCDENASNPSTLASDSLWLLKARAGQRKRPGTGCTHLGFPLLSSLGFQPLPASYKLLGRHPLPCARCLQHSQAFYSLNTKGARESG